MAQCKVFGFANRRKRKPTSLLVLVGYRTQGQTRSSAKLDVANVPAKYFKNGSTLDPPPQRSNAVTSKSTKTLKSNCISVILQFWKTHDRLVFVTTDHTRVQQCPSQLVEQQLAPAATTTTTITLNYKTTFVTYIVHTTFHFSTIHHNIFIIFNYCGHTATLLGLQFHFMFRRFIRSTAMAWCPPSIEKQPFQQTIRIIDHPIPRSHGP